MGRDDRPHKRSTAEKIAFAMLLGGEYDARANLIVVTTKGNHGSMPTYWTTYWCATKMVELTHGQAMSRINKRKVRRKGIGGFRP